MICPGCGTDNPEEALQCFRCGHKFQFGHAYNDPANMTFVNFSRRPKGIRILIGFFLLVMLLAIAAWLRSNVF